MASAALASVVIVTNLVALGMLVVALTRPSTPGGPLLGAAMRVWLTTVIGFALLYWELDQGGRGRRHGERKFRLDPDLR